MDVIRVYVGLESAETDVERVELALRELDRTHAFDREWLLIDLPTGTGYVNYAAVSVLEAIAVLGMFLGAALVSRRLTSTTDGIESRHVAPPASGSMPSSTRPRA